MKISTVLKYNLSTSTKYHNSAVDVTLNVNVTNKCVEKPTQLLH